MLPPTPIPRRLRRALASASLATALVTLAAAPAGAHFVLDAPASTTSQDTLGNPQKAPPCGDDGSGTASGMVTAFAEGQTITITIHETIFHPGHYRIALATHDVSELPAEPKVTAADTPCGTAEIQSPPVFPVLADGVLEHTAPFNGPQTVQVTLPPGVTCDKCTLQVIEFMAQHGLNNPGGCFYHHCADISINASTVPDGGATTSSSGGATTGTGGSPATGSGGAGGAGGDGAGGGGGEGTGSASGCGCSTPGGSTPAFAGLGSLLALAALIRSRRSRPRADRLSSRA